MSDWPDFIDPQDLAPGDLVPHKDLPKGIQLCRVESPQDPLFDVAYKLLDAQFGDANELELREVIEKRMGWKPDQFDEEGFAMSYEMLVLKVGDEVAAVRDHNAIVWQGEVTVHLSHVLVVPAWRRRGLAILLRTLPVTCGHRCAAAAGVPDAPVTLFCEMDPLDLSDPANRIRRISYERAGFLAIPPVHGFMQPDFRPASLIDADPNGPDNVLLDLLFRRVGREEELELSGAELLAHVRRIYQMYACCVRKEHMASCLRWQEGFRLKCPERLPLLPPTEAK